MNRTTISRNIKASAVFIPASLVVDFGSVPMKTCFCFHFKISEFDSKLMRAYHRHPPSSQIVCYGCMICFKKWVWKLSAENLIKSLANAVDCGFMRMPIMCSQKVRVRKQLKL